MAITITELTAGESNADASTYTTASVTLTAGRFYFMGIYTTKAVAGNPTAVATTGGGATFTQKNASTVGPSSYATWYCAPASTVTDTIVITCASSNGCEWAILEVIGSKTTGSPAGVDSFITAQVTAATASATTVTATLASNITAGNARIAFGNVIANESIAATSGTWTSGTLLNHSSPVASMRMAYNVTPATTDTSVIWTGAGSEAKRAYIIEIVADAGGSPVGFIPI